MTIPKSIEKELRLPVSFTSDGQKVTLDEYLTKKQNNVLSLSSLKPSQLAEITVDRIKEKPEVKLMMLGSEIIDKERAIAEVQAQSSIGQILMETEQYKIENLIKVVKRYLEKNDKVYAT